MFDTISESRVLGFDRGDWALFVGGCVLTTFLAFLA